MNKNLFNLLFIGFVILVSYVVLSADYLGNDKTIKPMKKNAGWDLKNNADTNTKPINPAIKKGNKTLNLVIAVEAWLNILVTFVPASGGAAPLKPSFSFGSTWLKA